MGYLDPGLFGVLSQVGLAVLLLAVSAFSFFFKPIKKLFLRIFKRKNPNESTTSVEESIAKQ
jgi:hypothetical protein